MIIVSFLKVVCTLKYPSNACLSYLDNGLGVLPVRHCLQVSPTNKNLNTSQTSGHSQHAIV